MSKSCEDDINLIKFFLKADVINPRKTLWLLQSQSDIKIKMGY